jgi:hypothetical protein
MDKFCNQYLSLCNKNYPIQISIGKKINEYMFDYKISDNQLESIILKIKELSKTDLEPYFNYVYEYKIKNEVYIRCNNTITTYTYNVIDSYMDNNYYMQHLLISIDNLPPLSTSNYDNNEEYEQMIINLNNQLDIEINKFKDYNTIKILIKKPILYNILNNYLKHIIIY